jgi:lipopolysaccharide biosynthesis glycosyltransferase
MILRKDYIERIKKLEDLKFNNWVIKDKLIHYLGDFSRGNLYEDLTKINFNALYPTILIGLFEAGLIDENWKEDIERVEWFLKNRSELKLLSPNEYQQCKIHCNSLYMKIKSPYVVEYLNIYYSDLLEKYCDRIIYIDVDLLILNIKKSDFQTKEIMPELKDFSLDVTFVNYFYAEELKRYIEQEESGTINVKGYRDETKKQYLLNLIKREIRRRKLDNLGI